MAHVVINNVLKCHTNHGCGSSCGGCCCCCNDGIDHRGIWAGLFLVKAKQNSYLDAIDQLNNRDTTKMNNNS